MQNERRSGQALVMVTFALTLMLGMLSLAVDLGWGYYRREVGQSAVDAAAAGAVTAVTVTTPVCGTGNVWCGSPAGTTTNCPATAPTTATNTYNIACMLAATNGYTTTGGKIVSVQANTTSPAPNAPGVSVNYWVTVRISETPATLFGTPVGIRGLSALSSNVIATAGVVSASSSNNASCMYILGTTGTTFTAGNDATATASGCGVYVNSTTNTGNGAMYATGSARLNAGWAKIAASGAGAYTDPNNGCYATSSTAACGSLTPSTGQTPVADPFSSLTAPSNPGGCASGNFSAWQASPYTPAPGCYNAFTTGNGMAVNLSPGLYYINGGEVNINSGSVTGNGVMFYLANGAYVSIQNGATVTLTASTTTNTTNGQVYEGVLFFQQRNYAGQTASTFAGGSSSNLTGTIYMPSSLVNFNNGSTESSTMALVANSVDFEGGATTFLQATSQSQTGLPVSTTSYSILQ